MDKMKLKEQKINRGNSKHFLPPINGGTKLNLELSFNTKSHM